MIAGAGRGDWLAGWVPTITGHLSFSLVGRGGDLRSCVTANFSEPSVAGTQAWPRRRVAIIQKRVVRDLPVTIWPTEVFKPSIKAHFVLLAETARCHLPALSPGTIDKVQRIDDHLGVLRGELWLVPHHEDRLKLEIAKELLGRVRRAIARWPGDVPAALPGRGLLDAQVRSQLARAEDNGLAVVRAEFELFRTGEFYLSQPELLSYSVGQDPSLQEQFGILVADQFYYFVKDLAHRHYHHKPTSDRMLPLTRANVADDKSWRRETLWSLTRSVLEARRRDVLDGYKSALGVLAYADAFQSLLGKVYRTGAQLDRYSIWKGAQGYDFSHTRASLNAKISELEQVEGSSSEFNGVLIGAALAAVALWVDSAHVLHVLCENSRVTCVQPPAWADQLLGVFVGQPGYIIAILLFVGSAWLGRRLRLTPLTRGLWRLINVWSLAAGASLSRAQDAVVGPGYSDVAGFIGAIGTALTIGLILLFGLGLLLLQL